MARVPDYGRRVSPAGPSRLFPGGALYDIGQSAMADTAGDFADMFAQSAERIRRAEEATQIIGRTADFTVGMTKLLADSLNKPTPQDGERFFRDGSEQMRQKALDWSAGSEESRTQLLDAIQSDYVRHHVKFLQVQQDRQIKNQIDAANGAYDTAVTTGNKVLAYDALDKLEEAGYITPAMREQRVKEFPVDMEIEQWRIQAGTDPQTAMQALQGMLTRPGITDRQTHSISTAIGVASQQMHRKSQALRTNDAATMIEVLRTVRGAVTGENAVTFEALEQRFAGDQISESTFRMAWDRLASKTGAEAAQQEKAQDEADKARQKAQDEADKARQKAERLRAYGILSRQTTRFLDGDISYEQWHAIYAGHQAELDEEDAEQFMDKAQSGRMSESDHARLEADKLASMVLEPIAPQIQVGDKKEYDQLQVDMMVGAAMRRLDTWQAEYFTGDKPFDASVYRAKANEIIGAVSREYNEQKNPKSKRSRRATATPAIPRVTSDADFDALPSGSEFIGPDGVHRRKP